MTLKHNKRSISWNAGVRDRCGRDSGFVVIGLGYFTHFHARIPHFTLLFNPQSTTGWEGRNTAWGSILYRRCADVWVIQGWLTATAEGSYSPRARYFPRDGISVQQNSSYHVITSCVSKSRLKWIVDTGDNFGKLDTRAFDPPVRAYTALA